MNHHQNHWCKCLPHCPKLRDVIPLPNSKSSSFYLMPASLLLSLLQRFKILLHEEYGDSFLWFKLFSAIHPPWDNKNTRDIMPYKIINISYILNHAHRIQKNGGTKFQRFLWSVNRSRLWSIFSGYGTMWSPTALQSWFSLFLLFS